MKKFAVTLNCEGLVEPKIVNINAKSEQEARAFIKNKYPKCTIVSIKEFLNG